MKKGCPICSHNEYETVIKLDESNQGRFINLSNKKYKGYLEEITPDFSKVKILRCSNCSHHWYAWKPNDRELINMYDKHVPERKKLLKTQKSKASKYIKRELIDLKKFIKKINPTLLDYGSGFGLWTSIAKDINFIVFAYEPSSNRLAKSKEINNHDINFINNLKDIAQKQIDLINIEQVLEHLPNPLGVLKELNYLSNTKTVVRIRVPNLAKCKEGKTLYKSWPFNDKSMHTLTPYAHLNGFTQSSLRISYSRAGFKPAYKFMFFYKPINLIRIVLGEYIKILETTTIYLIKK
ncbi:class I SAM-dependent methyltransferase [Prochlorococcus sp. MIT 1314]|uniref:class I SAM-dependent methyltransferase n=1 Tax=Prochlorococcus sp. MIT 1314 TaxID=3096220 RepID=UPI002A74BD0D|nr:class I SAM-dependent methyltransferase [Prochlorococcus sp. MIT 1314]